MELLERDGPLAALIEVCEKAARGEGSVVLVSGEPGIGKTALLSRFVAGLGDKARVLWGMCDDLSTPRPFGPLRDLGVATSTDLRAALSAEAPPSRIHSLLIEELEAPPRPTVLVIEDIHWTDQATLDAITVIGRRIVGLPAVLILSFRKGEVDPDHGLWPVLGMLRSGTSLYLQLAPLSRAAVAALAGDHADEVYAATGGNPFYVTEMLESLPEGLPPSVASAVLGRAARLPEPSRRLVELVSMVPSRAPTRILDLVMPGWLEAAEEPERRQLLDMDVDQVRFRHELARTAVRSTVPAARRRQLHQELVQAMLQVGADPADIAHHAEEAGDAATAAEYALTAARRAAAVESNREACAQFRRAAERSDHFSLRDQAGLFEEFAMASYLVGRLDDAFDAIQRAIAINEDLDQRDAVGRATRILSRLHWYAGDGESALREGRAAVEILEPLGASVELARAYSGLSQLAMLAARAKETLEWGQRAAGLAEKLGDDAVRAHALVNIGSIQMQADPNDVGTLLEAHRLADASGERHEAVRALLNLAYTAVMWIQPEIGWRYVRDTISYAAEHQVDTLLIYAEVISAWLYLREGAWEASERISLMAAETGPSVVQLLAKTVLAELAVRRGDADARARLDEIGDQADRTGELQRIGPVLQLETEWALTTGGEMPRERLRRATELVQPADGWPETAVAAWAAVAGFAIAVEGRAAKPHAAMLEHDWAGAADAFGEVGWVYERAVMLSLLDVESALREGLDIARRLGAAPLEGRISRRMRKLGMSLPRRPRMTTMANPAGLTPRQLEVLELLSQGLTNAEIAERLYVSPRTAEHHVEAIFTKLGVSTRREAASRYAELRTSS